MAEFGQAPTVPPQPWFDPKTGNATEAFRRFILGERGRIANVNSGVASLVASQQVAQANAQTAINNANQAAQAAIAASGSTETDQDYDSDITVSSGTFTTFLTNNLNHAGGGDYTITGSILVTGVISSTPAVSSGTTFLGEWQIIENPNAHVLASGTFTVTSSPNGEGGTTYYENTISFGTNLPDSDAYADNESGAVTIELQLRRSSGSNSVSGLYASLLTQWA